MDNKETVNYERLFMCDNCHKSTEGKHVNIWLPIPRLFRTTYYEKWGKVCIDCFLNHEPTRLELIEGKKYHPVNLSGTYKRYMETEKTKKMLKGQINNAIPIQKRVEEGKNLNQELRNESSRIYQYQREALK